MDRGLSGKNALITGGGSGIGRAIAVALAEEGVNIAIGSNRAEDDALSEIKGHGVKALHFLADVSVEAEVTRMVDEAIQGLGSIELYVNNAAITNHQAITRISSAHTPPVRNMSSMAGYICAHCRCSLMKRFCP